MNQRSTPLASALLVALVLAGSCDTSVHHPDTSAVDAASISQSCMDAADHSDLPWIQEEIFTRSCARFTACHKDFALQAAELNLEDGNSEGNLVGVPSTLFPDRETLVIPGDPDGSYLMIMLGEDPFGDAASRLTDAGTMPFNNPLLCQEKRDAIARWIAGLQPGGSIDAGPGPDAAPPLDAP